MLVPAGETVAILVADAATASKTMSIMTEAIRVGRAGTSVLKRRRMRRRF